MMHKLLTLGITILTGSTLAACGNTKQAPSKASQATTSSKQQSGGISLANYETIKVALPNLGSATSEAEVKKLLGKPDQETKTTVTGLDQQATQYGWTNVGKGLTGATVTVSIYDGKAVAKGYANASLTTNSKITASSLSAIKTGTSLDTVKAKLGKPNGEVLSGAGALSSQLLTYTNIKGEKAGASVSFTFTANKLVSMTKTGFN
ncbi:DUF3862 domain-containing protein [Lactiplantibacillus plajomi]